jgi:tetratricopeptide (TPR) repeat protein
MFMLLASLSAQVAGPCPRAPLAAAEVDAGWRAYRGAALSEASGHFAAADSLCPADHGRTSDAAARFERAVASDPQDADAWYGLGLARVRRGERAAAIAAWRQTLRVAPGYADAEQQLLALGSDSGLALAAVRRPAEPVLPARTAGDGFEVAAGGAWRPFYVKGINLGVALPGRFASEFPEDD